MIVRLPLLILFATLPGFAQSTCKPQDLVLDAATASTLLATDCRLRDAVGTNMVPDAKAKVFSISADSEGVLTISLQSQLFDPAIYLADSDSRVRALAAGKNKEGKLVVHVPKGTFSLIASATTVALGDFQIAASFETMRDCAPKDLILGQSSSSTFNNKSCRELDLTLYSTRDIPVQLYNLKVVKLSVLTAEMSSMELDSAVTLLSAKNVFIGMDDNGGGEKDARLLTSIAPGDYVLHLNSQDKNPGNFNFNVKLEDPRPCPAKPLLSGTPINSTFDDQGCRYLDVFVPSARTSPMVRYEFTNNEKGWIDLSMAGTTVQSSLLIYDANATLQTRQTAVLVGQKAQIIYSMKPGVYTLFASTIGNLNNDYSLNLQFNKLPVCEVLDLPVAFASRALVRTNCRILDYIVPSRDAGVAEAFRIPGNKSRMLNSLLQSSSFDPYLYLIDSTGLVVFEDDDSGGGPDGYDAFINTLLPEGEHMLLVTSFDGGPGSYKLTSSISDAKNCDSGALSLIGIKSTAFVVSDCVAREAIPYFDVDYKAHLYSINVPTKGMLSLAATSNALPLLSVLFTDRFQGISMGTNAGNTPLLMNGPLPAGRYLVAMFAPPGRLGEYSLTLNFVPDTGPVVQSSRMPQRNMKQLIFPASQPADEVNVPFQKVKRR